MGLTMVRARTRQSWLAAFMLALGAGNVHPADDEIAYMYSFTGRYTRAEYGERSLLNDIASSRVVYIFLKNNRFIYGLGRDDQTYFLSGGTDHFAAKNLASEIDTLSTPEPEYTLATRPVSGRCDMTGELEKSVTIVCKGKDQANNYHFVFVSDDTEATFSPGHEPEDVAANIKHAMYLFDELYRERGMEQVQDYVAHCYKTASTNKHIPTLVACGAIDYASAFVDEWATKNQRTAEDTPQTTSAAVGQRLSEKLATYYEKEKPQLDPSHIVTLVETTEYYARVYLKQMMVKRSTN
ncbi:MAG: hypothetical protein AABY83_09585 [Pseudomonadota bacterium]